MGVVISWSHLNNPDLYLEPIYGITWSISSFYSILRCLSYIVYWCTIKANHFFCMSGSKCVNIFNLLGRTDRILDWDFSPFIQDTDTACFLFWIYWLSWVEEVLCGNIPAVTKHGMPGYHEKPTCTLTYMSCMETLTCQLCIRDPAST